MTAPSTTVSPEGVREPSPSRAADDLAHMYCGWCYPESPGPGVGLCGTPGWSTGLPITKTVANECPKCRKLLGTPCPVCGA